MEKFENNWLSKTLENLEKDNWREIPKNQSYLVTTCHKLRKKQLKDFEVEDLRIMIGQNIGLKYLIPIAIDTLKNDVLIAGDFYEGDLLKSVLTSNENYWKKSKNNWQKIITLFNKNIEAVKKEASQYKTGKDILEAFKKFETIN